MGRRDNYIFAKKRQSQYIKEIFITAILIVLILLVALFLFFNLFGSNVSITLMGQDSVEIGSNVKASDLIKEIKKGTLKEDAVIDTSHLGTTRVEVIIDKNGREKPYGFDVEIVDTTPPEIGAQGQVNIIRGTNIDIKTQVQVTDNSGEEPALNIVGTCDSNTPGSYPISVSATDSSGNGTTKEVTVNVIDVESHIGDFTFITEKGYTGETVGGVTTIDGLAVVNRSFNLPEDYGPWALTEETDSAYWEMVSDAWEKDGLELFAISTFRSYWDQEAIYESYIWEKGYDWAAQYCARPGFSEHQLGLAIDMNLSEEEFDQTDEGKWLAENCHKYGFILRYPKGKEKQTGYSYEPWHIRYVGKEKAEIFYNGGNWITLEEYYGIPSQYSSSDKEFYQQEG